jgi:hypothetical protein
MGAWVLQQLRREHLVKRKQTDDIEQFFEIRGAKKAHSYF